MTVVCNETTVVERAVDLDRGALSQQEMARLIQALSLSHDDIKPDDVLMSLLLIAGVSNWNDPTTEDTAVGASDGTDFGKTKFPLWTCSPADSDGDGDDAESDDSFTVPPLRMS